MKYSASVVLGIAPFALAQQDTFNYRGTSGNDYGPSDWDRVSCNNLDTCVSRELFTARMKRAQWHLIHSIALLN